MRAAVETAVRIHEEDLPGDILIFLTGAPGLLPTLLVLILPRAAAVCEMVSCAPCLGWSLHQQQALTRSWIGIVVPWVQAV